MQCQMRRRRHREHPLTMLQRHLRSGVCPVYSQTPCFVGKVEDWSADSSTCLAPQPGSGQERGLQAASPSARSWRSGNTETSKVLRHTETADGEKMSELQ